MLKESENVGGDAFWLQFFTLLWAFRHKYNMAFQEHSNIKEENFVRLQNGIVKILLGIWSTYCQKTDMFRACFGFIDQNN